MKNETFTMPRRVFNDSKTGREVWQVTDGEWECVAPYMDVRAWTKDDKYLVFTSNRSGSWQPYRLEIESGEATRFLEQDVYAGYRSVALDPTHNMAYCQDGRRVLAVHIETLKARLAFDHTALLGPVNKQGNMKGHAGALNTDGSLSVIEANLGDGNAVAGDALLVTPLDGSNQGEVLRIPRADLSAGHVLFCTGDDNIISFHGYPDRQNDSQEKPDNRVAQWRLTRDKKELKPLVLLPPGYRAIHSTWGASGDRFYFHRKSVPGWTPTALCSVNRDGEDMKVYYETNAWKLGHSASSPDEKWLVTDSQDIDENVLMLVSTQRDEQHMLCWPSMSQKCSTRPHKRSTHLPPHTDVDTHPGWSATGKYVHYTSDISGRSQIYVVPVSDVVNSK